MARKGNSNGGFESDPESGSAQRTVANRRQGAASYGGSSSGGFLGTEATRESIPVTVYVAGSVAPNNIHRWKEAATQTDSSPTTVSSWKILRSQSTDVVDDTSRLSVASDYVVVETRALAYHASVQTQDAHLFRYSEARVLEMVIAWQMITLFIPTTWYLLLYIADQVSSVTVAASLCSAGEHWWCGLTVTFLVLPSLIINAYAYEQLVQPDIATVAPVNKWLARGLVLLQVAPHYLIGRKVLWCFRAWRAESWPSKRRTPRNGPPYSFGKTPQELWDQAKEETESSTTKWFHSLLESVPQLSVQSYILLVLLSPGAPTHSQGMLVNAGLVVSVVVSLTSASSGLASVVSERAWERVAASLAIFFTLGSRVMVCSGVGTIHPMLWFAPVTAATFLGFVTKLAESTEQTYCAMLVKAHKYLFNGFVMAVVCPPFDTVGLFSSAPYVLAGLCFLTLSPGSFTNIAVFVMSIAGQVVWLAVGFFITGDE